MSETKRTKAPSTRRRAGDSAVAVLEAEQAAVPALDGIDGLDDILGEIASPPKAEPLDDLDDILGEIAAPAAAAPLDELDDILGEIAPSPPAPVEAADGFDDILSEIAGPAPVAADAGFDDILSEIAGPAPAAADAGFDDILSEIAGPAPVAAADGFDDILSEIAGPATAAPAPTPAASLDDILGEIAGPGPVSAPVSAIEEAKAKGARRRAAAARAAEEADDLSAMLDEMAPQMPAPIQPAAASPEPAAAAPGMKARAAKLAGSAMSLKGTREISRKAYAGLLGAVGVLGLATIGQAAYILLHPSPTGHAAPAQHGAQAPAPAIPLVPVDYSKIDLTRYRDKERSLGEGGRDMLRNPAIKDAVLQLVNGEALYNELRNLSRLSKAADLVSIREDRLTINSCNLTACADKSFRLVYDLQRESAKVCMTEKYINGSYLSYSYGPEGYREEPSCNDGANPVAAALPVAGYVDDHAIPGGDDVAEEPVHGAEVGEEGGHAAEH